MKILKAFFAAFFVLFSVSIMNAQSSQSCFDLSGNFSMEITSVESISSETCFNVTVSYTPPKGQANANKPFVKHLNQTQSAYSNPFSTQVCYPTNFPHTQSVIYCGLEDWSGWEVCRDGCTVIIEPKVP